MFEAVILFLLGVFAIIFASVEDLRTREVSNWISYSLIIFALGFRLFFSIFSEDYSFFVSGLFGLFVFFIVGNALYYSRIFAGGDYRLMVAMGPILGFSTNVLGNISDYFSFIVLFLICGGVYGLFVSLGISLGNFKSFKKKFHCNLKQSRKGIYLFCLIGLLLMLFGFIESVLFSLGVLVFVSPYLVVYARTIDNFFMVKNINVKDLKEGDWIYERVKVGKKFVESSWDGASREDIKLLKKHHRRVKIREGVPFVPVFLFSYLGYMYFYFNPLWFTFW